MHPGGKVQDAPGNAAPTHQSPPHIPWPQNSSAPEMPCLTQLMEDGAGSGVSGDAGLNCEHSRQ